jgi:rubrerythrin
MAETPKKETIEVVLKNWRAEVETARVYRDLAERESDEKRKGILIRMAEAEERHARRWEQKLRDLGEPVPALTDNIWTRFKRRFTRSLGTDIAIRRMEAAEEKHEREFSAQRDRVLAGEQDVQEFLRTSALEEKAHARALNAMAGPPNPKTALDTILKRERWHGRGGSWVADAIYGVNDGLGAVFGIVSGVAGATNNEQHYVLISGLAGMLASALSMGAGAYLAVKSEKTLRRKSKRWRFSTNSKASAWRNHKRWPSASRRIRINWCRRWPKASSGFPSIASLIHGNQRLQHRSPPQWARSFPSSLSFS